MKDDLLRVVSCPLCRIFTDDEVVTKLHWPLNREDVPKSRFVIVDCKTCKVPMVVLNEHITEIQPKDWNNIMFRCKKLFGKNIRFRHNLHTIRDHIHIHIIKVIR